MRMLTDIRLVTIPLRSEIVQCLTHVLFAALIISKEVDQAFVNTTKLMVYSISFPVKVLAKVFVRLINICT